MSTVEKCGPVEVWLSQRNIEVRCTVVHENESTKNLDVDALTMRGAQREITGYLINQGYQPEGRWETELADGEASECVRRFRVGSKA